MLLSNLTFAGMGAFAHALARHHVDWQLTAICRAGLVLVFAFILALGARAPLVWWRPGILWLRSLAGSCSMVCTFYAYANLPLSVVLTLTNTFPLWVALLSWVFFGDRPGGLFWLAAGTGILGVVLIAVTLNQQPHQDVGTVEVFSAVCSALGASFFTSVAMLGLNRLGDFDARAIVVHFSAVALVFCVAAYFVFPRHAAVGELPDGESQLMLLGIGVTATFGQICLTKAFATGVATKVSVVGLTQVVFALALDVCLFGHQLLPLSLLGMVLVLAPTAWVVLASRTVDQPGDEKPLSMS
jgi:drug/metabolite transporter (DMT)-like permease